MSSFMGKTRKPKFELHLKIHDLNNIPLVSGTSFVKWHLAHSMHAEHRGRTSKCPISNHRVDYAFSKTIPSIRMSIDKNNNLTECPLELEVVQEFAVTEKITLGLIKLNLSEYVEESEAFARDVASPPRKRSSAGLSPTSSALLPGTENPSFEDGIVRRYLMQESKVNSTLKISILVVQLDGERNFIAPPLRTAPVFGGIAGFVAPEQIEDETGPLPSISKPRDASEVQDLYRRTLVASWCREPSELSADECIEDIFSGGNGWRTSPHESNQLSADTDDDTDVNHGTLRPSDFRRMANQHQHQSSNHHHSRDNSASSNFLHLHHHHHQSHHRRAHSASSEKSVLTVTGGGGGGHRNHRRGQRMGRDDGRDDDLGSHHSESLTSLTPTLGSGSNSDRVRGGDHGLKKAREVPEADVRDDFTAWRLPGGLAA